MKNVKIQPNSKILFLTRIGREIEGRIQRRNWVFLSKCWLLRREYVCRMQRRDREIFFRISNFERNFEKNLFFKILTIEKISRNEHSILQLEIKKTGPFPLKISSRSRISSMPAQQLPGWCYFTSRFLLYWFLELQELYQLSETHRTHGLTPNGTT